MIKNVFVIASVLVVLASCKDGSKNETKEIVQEDLIASVVEMEDSIMKLSNSNEPVTNLHNLELINRCLDFQKHFPEAKEAPTYLDKVHMLYSKMNVYDKAASYVDTILSKYPTYENRLMLIESQAGSYDVFITPRDTSKVRYYYDLLLKEDTNMDASKRKDIEKRLGQIVLDFDQYLEFLNQETASK